MNDKIELNNSFDGKPINTVGELKRILEPFMDDCKLNDIRVRYIPINGNADAKLEIALVCC